MRLVKWVGLILMYVHSSLFNNLLIMIIYEPASVCWIYELYSDLEDVIIQIFMTVSKYFHDVSHCHENKMFHDGVTTFSWQCWALTKVIYFVVVHSFSWRVRAPMKLDFVAAIHSHENIYSYVFWTATNYFRVVFLNLATLHFHGGGSPPRKRYVTVHSHENSIFVALDSWGLFRDRRPSRNIFVAGFIVFVTVSHSHEISVFW